MEILTHEDVRLSRETTYLDTLYGRKIGVKRITMGAFIKAEALFAAPVERPDGTVEDPMKIGFLDVECAACEAREKQACSAFGDERVPHAVRVRAARSIRVTRANRLVLRASLVDPAPTTETLEYLEGKPDALKDLTQQLTKFNSTTPAAQGELTTTFPEGAPDPEQVPAGS